MLLHQVALEHFLEVARTGSISEASRRLHVAGSAISRQITKLEQEVGVPLFERRARGMALSEAGTALAAYARRVSLETGQILEEIRGIGGSGTTVGVASSQGAAQELLPRVMSAFQKEHPTTRFRLHVTAPAAASQQVRDGTADLAVTFSLAPSSDIRVLHSQRAPIQALMRADHPLAARDHVELRDLLPYPIALFEEGTTNRQLFDICCAVEGPSFDPVLISTHPGAMSVYIKESGAVSLTGHITVHDRLEREGLRAVPITNPEMHQRTIQVQAMVGRHLPAAVSAFADHLVHELTETEI